MTTNQNKLETEVQSGLVELLGLYQGIAHLVDGMLKKQGSNEDISSEMQQLETARREVELVESKTKEAKERYRSASRTASPTIKKLIADSAKLLVDTVAKIEILENNTKAAQQKLLPQIGESVRANQMQRAYGDR